MLVEKAGSKEKLEKLVAEVNSYKELFVALKINHTNSGWAYREAKREFNEFQIDYEHLKPGSGIVDALSDEDFRSIAESSNSVRSIALAIGAKYDANANVYRKIKKRLESLGIEELAGQSWLKNSSVVNSEVLRKRSISQRLSWDKMFANPPGCKSNNKLFIERLIQAGKKKYACEMCGISSWQEKPIRLVLDHIDGNSLNCLEGNLRILCPCCHSQTETFCCGQDRSRKEGGIKEWYDRMLWFSDNPDLELALGENMVIPRFEKVKPLTCEVCLSSFKPRHQSQKFCSIKCSHVVQRKTERPSKEELKKLIENNSWCAIGRMYNVSDNAVRKWAKSEGLI